MRRMNGLTLYPKKSLTTNIGFDGSGDNCGVSNKFYIEIDQLQDYVTVSRIPIVVNKKAFRIAKVFKSGHWYSKRNINAFYNRIKSYILK